MFCLALMKTCTAKSVNGRGCERDGWCQSDVCSDGVCVECDSHSHCNATQYCDDNVKKCTTKLQHGSVCSSSHWCASDICNKGWSSTGTCRECERTSHCPDDKYCGESHRCMDKLRDLHSCTSDDHCLSDHCIDGMCRNCTSDSDCYGETMFCLTLTKTCTAKSVNGRGCERDGWCQSGRCRDAKCIDCETDFHCLGTQYCDEANACKAKLELGSVCSNDEWCASGACNDVGTCVECKSHDQCNSTKTQFCGDANTCRAKLATGVVCQENAQCARNSCGGCCDHGLCGTCTCQ